MSGDDLTLFALGHVKGLDSGEQKGSGANGVVNKVTVNRVACIANTRRSRLEKVSYQHKFAAECTLLSKLSRSNVIHFFGSTYGRSANNLSCMVMECLATHEPFSQNS